MNFRATIERPLFNERDPRPTVRLPSAGVPRSVLAVGAGLLALATFLLLRGNDTSASEGLERESRLAPLSSPAPLQTPIFEADRSIDEQRRMFAQRVPSTPTTSVAAAPVIIYRDRPPQRIILAPAGPPSVAGPIWSGPSGQPDPQPIYAPSELPPPTSNAAAIAFDRGGTTVWSTGSSVSSRQHQGVSDDSSVSRPRAAADSATIILAGTIIPAVLETPIDTGQSGMARAIISKAIRSYDGTRVLIPRGSKVVGNVDGSGGSQVMVKWAELTLPDGTSFIIDSPAASADGRTGIPGRSRSGGVGRFLGGVLQTALAVGSSLVVGNGGAMVLGVPSAVAGTMGGRSRSSRTTVEAGKQISIVTAKKLDFTTAPQP